ncbi:MAG: hypothetical protein AB8B56_20855, partial [Crocinitomicaceae bacterium]
MRNSLRTPMALLFSVISFCGFSQNAEDQIQHYLNDNKEALELTESDIQNWRISDQHFAKQTNLHHVYISQEYNGTEIFGSNAVFAMKGDNVVLTGNRLEQNISGKIVSPAASLTNVEAIYAAANSLNLEVPLTIDRLEDKDAETSVFSAPGLSLEPIPVRLVYFVEEDQLTLAWKLSIYELSTDHWWEVLVNANDGTLVEKYDWVVSCSFGHDHSAENHGTIARRDLSSVP